MFFRRRRLAGVICVGVALYGALVAPSSAVHRKFIALSPQARAVYQVCLLFDVPVSFFGLMEDDPGAGKDVLGRVAKLLTSLGFKVVSRTADYEDFVQSGARGVVLDERGDPMVGVLRESEHRLLSYPHKPRRVTGEAFRALWPCKAVLILRAPPEKSGQSPLRVEPPRCLVR